MPAIDNNSVLEAAFSLLSRGGLVLLPIFLLGWFGWFLMIERYCYYFIQKRASMRAFKNCINKNCDLGSIAIRNSIEEVRHNLSINLSKSMKTIAMCASLAPMLGLLGTVSGMVHTFDTIKLFGFGNPVLLADGISEALLTTQAGLLVAFPLMLSYNFLATKIEKLESSAWNNALKFEALALKALEAK